MQSIRAQFPNVSDETWPILEKWAVLLREWNEKINLISRKDIEHLEEHHLSHCLEITNHLKLMNGARVMDVGTGGGFPGIIMAICYPQAQFTLIDSIGKKIKVVQDLVDQLGLKNVEAKQTRAEQINKEFDFITGRAVKNLPEYFSWIKGNVRKGQRNSIPNGVLYWKGGDMDDELDALGIRPRKVINLEKTFSDPYFEKKYILHFDARDVPRARKPKL
ncbi:MAG TPA: 16S rRNA (guanine(527)-N(7))-methyltransferase RsmG [Opitutae bacterium]|nr:16S rRNA (guanine(527)-N(7))-methyltransferase RsmG [Opitutae bacterium]